MNNQINGFRKWKNLIIFKYFRYFLCRILCVDIFHNRKRFHPIIYTIFIPKILFCAYAPIISYFIKIELP